MKHFSMILLSVVFFAFLFSSSAVAGHWLLKELPDSVKVFKEDLIAFSKTEIDKEVARLQKKLEKTPFDRKESVKAEIDALKYAKSNLESVEIGTKLFESTKGGFDAVKKLGTEWEANGYSSTPTSFIPEEVNLKQLKTYSNVAFKGYDYYKKITGLNGKLKAMNTQGYSQETENLIGALTTMGTLMSEFGEKVPFIGAFMKGYGDLTVGFVDAVQKLNKTVVTNINQGCIGTGTRADSGNMNQAWDEQGLAGVTACRENGLANVYGNTDNPTEFYLWDPLTSREVGKDKEKKKGRWWFVNKVAPGLSLEGLEKRYKAIFEKSGGKIKNPSAKQVLHEYAKAVELRITAENIGVSPGGEMKVKASGIRVSDGQEIKGLFFELSQTVDGTTTKVKCNSGDTVKWQVPTEKGPYALAAELQKESSAIWRPVNTGKLKYFVGTPSFVRLALKPTVVIMDENGVPDSDSFKLLVSVSDENGVYLDQGFLSLKTEPTSFGTFRPNDTFYEKSLAEGNIEVIWTPYAEGMEKGELNFIADYEGFESKYSDIYLCPAWAEKELLIYETQPVSMKITKVKVEGEKKWNISVSLEDSNGQLVPKGTLKFKADAGGFMVGSGLEKELEIDSSDIGVVWQEPEGIDAPVKITVTSSEVRSDDMILYPEKAEMFYLPEVIELPTEVVLTAKKDGSADKTWNLSAQAVSAVDGAPVEAYPYLAMLYLTADKGTFSSSGKGSELFKNAGKKHSLSWIEPADLTGRVKITAQFLACEGFNALYSESTAFIHLPDYLLATSRINCDVKVVDVEQNLWELKMSVNDSSEQGVATGKLRIKTDAGTFSGGYTGLEWDLSATASPIMQWQGSEGDIANVTIDYIGDGEGATGENIRYEAAKLTVAVPQEQDLEAPIIDISGVLNNKEHASGTRVDITVTDNLEAPLSIDGLLSSDIGSSAISFNLVKENNRYFWSQKFTGVGNYTIDVKAVDSMSNESKKIISFKIKDNKEESYKFNTDFEMSTSGTAVLKAYLANLDLQLDDIKHIERINEHEKSCSICSNGGRRLVDKEESDSYVASRRRRAEEVQKELNERITEHQRETGSKMEPSEIGEMEEEMYYMAGLSGHDSGCPPGWECDIECPAKLSLNKPSGKHGPVADQSSKAREKWEVYLKDLYNGYSDLKYYGHDTLQAWNMEYRELIENWPDTAEEMKKRSLEIENTNLKKLRKKEEAADIFNEESRIWDKYKSMLSRVQKGFSSDFDGKNYGSSSKYPDRRWGLKRELESKVKNKGSVEFKAAIPEFMSIEEYYIIVAEMDARQKNEEKKYFRKKKEIIDEIKAESAESAK